VNENARKQKIMFILLAFRVKVGIRFYGVSVLIQIKDKTCQTAFIELKILINGVI
jgi:hypothetical protein